MENLHIIDQIALAALAGAAIAVFVCAIELSLKRLEAAAAIHRDMQQRRLNRNK